MFRFSRYTNKGRKRLVLILTAVCGLAVLAAAGGAGYQYEWGGWSWGGGCHNSCYTPHVYTPPVHWYPTYQVSPVTNNQTNNSTVNVNSNVNNLVGFSGITPSGGFSNPWYWDCGCQSGTWNSSPYTPSLPSVSISQFGLSSVNINVDQQNNN